MVTRLMMLLTRRADNAITKKAVLQKTEVSKMVPSLTWTQKAVRTLGVQKSTTAKPTSFSSKTPPSLSLLESDLVVIEDSSKSMMLSPYTAAIASTITLQEQPKYRWYPQSAQGPSMDVLVLLLKYTLLYPNRYFQSETILSSAGRESLRSSERKPICTSVASQRPMNFRKKTVSALMVKYAARQAVPYGYIILTLSQVDCGQQVADMWLVGLTTQLLEMSGSSAPTGVFGGLKLKLSACPWRLALQETWTLTVPVAGSQMAEVTVAAGLETVMKGRRSVPLATLRTGWMGEIEQLSARELLVGSLMALVTATTTVPLQQQTLEVLALPFTQTQLGYIWQIELQPSSFAVFPSSQAQSKTRPSPQISTQVFVALLQAQPVQHSRSAERLLVGSTAKARALDWVLAKMEELAARPEKLVLKTSVWFWMVASMKQEALYLPLPYLSMEVLRVKSEALGVTRKPVQFTNGWAKTALAGVSWKVKVMVSQMAVSIMVSTRAKVTEEAKKQALGEPLQAKLGSTVQAELQPSQLAVLPSSHCSTPTTQIPSPQRVTHPKAAVMQQPKTASQTPHWFGSVVEQYWQPATLQTTQVSATDSLNPVVQALQAVRLPHCWHLSKVQSVQKLLFTKQLAELLQESQVKSAELQARVPLLRSLQVHLRHPTVAVLQGRQEEAAAKQPLMQTQVPLTSSQKRQLAQLVHRFLSGWSHWQQRLFTQGSHEYTLAFSYEKPPHRVWQSPLVRLKQKYGTGQSQVCMQKIEEILHENPQAFLITHDNRSQTPSSTVPLTVLLANYHWYQNPHLPSTVSKEVTAMMKLSRKAEGISMKPPFMSFAQV